MCAVIATVRINGVGRRGQVRGAGAIQPSLTILARIGTHLGLDMTQ